MESRRSIDAAWRGPERLRIFINSRYRVIALDAKTGETISSVGTNGTVYLANANGVQRADAEYPLLASDSIFTAGLWDAMFAPISGGNATSCLGCSLSRDGRHLAIASETTGALYDFTTGGNSAVPADPYGGRAR